MTPYGAVRGCASTRRLGSGVSRRETGFLAFLYYPVVNWLTNVCGGLMDMTLDLVDAAEVVGMDSDFLHELLHPK